MNRQILATLALSGGLAVGATCGHSHIARANTTQSQFDIRGAWRPETYQLKDGTRHRVDGLIFFTKTEWTVLFFVLDGQGAAQRGSGEGGSYTLSGDTLVFTHLYNLSGGGTMPGLPANPLRMEVRDAANAPTEACRIEGSGDELTIRFPSGNSMRFRRSSGF